MVYNTFGGVGGSYYGYLNGVLANSISVSPSRAVPTGTPLSYPVGLGDSNNCGSGAYFNGSALDYQVYNVSLNATQIARIYHQGAFAVPKVGNTLDLWLPLNGNSNDFSGLFNHGFPYNVKYTQSAYKPQSFYNAFQISKASTPMYITYNGVNRLYNVSVVTWR